jgi:hypothetical protein
MKSQEVRMAAYRERAYLFPEEDGQPGWILDLPIWWRRSEFFEKYGSRQIDTGNPFHVNYALLLTAWEAMAWNRACQEQFSQDPRSQMPSVLGSMREWAAKLDSASWVIVESYEWESGIE